MKRLILGLFLGGVLVGLVSCSGGKDTTFERSNNLETNNTYINSAYRQWVIHTADIERIDDGKAIQICKIKLGKTKISDFSENDFSKIQTDVANTVIYYTHRMDICSDIILDNVFMVYHNDTLISFMFDESSSIKNAIEIKYDIEIVDDIYEYNQRKKLFVINIYDPFIYDEHKIFRKKKVIVLTNKKLLDKIIKMEKAAIESIYKQRELEEKNRLKSSGF